MYIYIYMYIYMYTSMKYIFNVLILVSVVAQDEEMK